MPIEFYRVLHLAGLALVAAALGAAAWRARLPDPPPRGALLPAAHGVGLALLLVAGMGMLARLGIAHAGLPGWVWGKLAIWLLLGGALPLLRRLPSLALVAWWSLPVLVAGAAALAIFKP